MFAIYVTQMCKEALSINNSYYLNQSKTTIIMIYAEAFIGFINYSDGYTDGFLPFCFDQT